MTAPSKPNAPKSSATVPIPDSNHNGVLDSTDLLAQMQREEKNGLGRTPSERAHGVLSVAQAGMLNIGWNTKILELDPRYLPELKAASANVLTRNLLDQIKAFNADANYANTLKQRTDTLTDLSTTDIALIKSDIDSFAAFAKTFRQQFPRGIKLDGESMPEILGHFGGLLLPAPATPSAPRPATPEKPSITI